MRGRRDEVARLIFAKQRCDICGGERNAHARLIRHLEGREREATIREIGGRSQELAVVAQEGAVFQLCIEINMRCVARFIAEGLKRQRRLAEVAFGFADHQRHIARGGQARDQIVEICNQANRADGRVGRMPAPSVSL